MVETVEDLKKQCDLLVQCLEVLSGPPNPTEVLSEEECLRKLEALSEKEYLRKLIDILAQCVEKILKLNAREEMSLIDGGLKGIYYFGTGRRESTPKKDAIIRWIRDLSQGKVRMI